MQIAYSPRVYGYLKLSKVQLPQVMCSNNDSSSAMSHLPLLEHLLRGVIILQISGKCKMQKSYEDNDNRNIEKSQ